MEDSCTNTAGSYSCSNCTTGYAGQICASCATGYTAAGSPDGKTCSVGQCDATSCVNGGTCTNSVDTFTCACPIGYDNLENCGMWIYCGDIVTRFMFMLVYPFFLTIAETCASGFTVEGSTDGSCIRDNCESRSCVNGGTCSNTETSYSCACTPPYAGSNCCTFCAVFFVFILGIESDLGFYLHFPVVIAECASGFTTEGLTARVSRITVGARRVRTVAHAPTPRPRFPARVLRPTLGRTAVRCPLYCRLNLYY